MTSKSPGIFNRPIIEEFKQFTEDLPSLEYQAACQYILLKPIRNAYHEIIHHLNYSTDFKIYPDDDLNTFETQLRHSIRTRLSYLTELTEDQKVVVIKAAAAMKSLTILRKLLDYWDKTLSTLDMNIPIHQVAKVKDHFADDIVNISKNDDPLNVIHSIYQAEVTKICKQYHLEMIAIPPITSHRHKSDHKNPEK